MNHYITLSRRWCCWGYTKWSCLTSFRIYIDPDMGPNKEVITQDFMQRLFNNRYLFKYMTRGKRKTIKLTIDGKDYILYTHKTKFNIVPYDRAIHGSPY